ncbi:uncharacterized protein LOC119287243 [Triticum dicoccoides]|uniref:uncharacterized protein LOC119287243 n=1 Tax=Triticum dicoccoides TaxID=85692 RepID=UPI00188E8DE2|nr:uncharacterized protein LOC119287243 [Triticum dicoccoides]
MRGGNHLAMKSLVQLFNEWEIQLLVLFSFTLQFFLFFAGGLRRRIRNCVLRSSIWLAYLGADLVAAYVLGLITRQEVSTHHLFFLWAPFLLIHLGGQDTITAFAIEDNSLWRRHLLNLVVQVSLTLYIFWKSFDGGPNMQLLAPSILLFVTGTIKYGERTWALWCGSLTNIRDSDGHASVSELRFATSSDPVMFALVSTNAMRCFFTGFRLPTDFWHIGNLRPDFSTKLFWIMEIELSVMFDDIYTKALVLRTWGCTILRCISHLSFLAAFVLFFYVVRNKERRQYNFVDTAITYGLFFGGFSLEVSSVCIIMRSPGTWAWLWKKTRNCSFLGSVVKWCIRTRCPRKRWSNSMGQYNILDYLGQSRKLVNMFFRTGEQKLWISKLLDTKFVQVDEQIMRCVVRRIAQYRHRQEGSPQAGQLENLGPFLQKIVKRHHSGFDCPSIIGLHLFTEILLSRYVRTGTAMDSESSDASVRVCRMISQYMLYLLLTHPKMLPTISSDSGVDQLVASLYVIFGADNDMMVQAVSALAFIDMPEPPGECAEAHLLELQEAWVGVLLHAASKSRPEMHATLLAKGGELLTFIWLLMAHYELGDVQGRPIEMTADAPTVRRHYAFCFPPQPQAS